MNHVLLSLFAVACLLFSAGCKSDDNDSSASSAASSFESHIVVSGRSADVIGGRDGDIYQLNGGGWRVIATRDTQVYIQRESCSGMVKGNANQIQIGSTIFFKFDPSEVGSSSIKTVRATQIEAYLPACIGASPNNIGIEVRTNITSVTNITTQVTFTTNIVRN